MIDRNKVLLPKFEAGEIRYKALPLFEILGLNAVSLSFSEVDFAVQVYGHLLPPVALSLAEFKLAQKTKNNLFCPNIEQFMTGFECVDETTGCWLRPLASQFYNAPSRTSGSTPRYPRFKNRRAHISSLDIFLGNLVPDSEYINRDHLCSNHACSNPRHVEPVTIAVNSARARNRRNEGHRSLGGAYYSAIPELISFEQARQNTHLFDHDDGLDAIMTNA